MTTMSDQKKSPESRAIGSAIPRITTSALPIRSPPPNGRPSRLRRSHPSRSRKQTTVTTTMTTTVMTTVTTAAATTTTPARKPIALRLYFLAPDGKLVAVSREVAQTQAPGGAALHELLAPPDGMSTKVPDHLALT